MPQTNPLTSSFEIFYKSFESGGAGAHEFSYLPHLSTGKIPA